MSNYGQLVTFSTGSAPHLCSGVCKNFRTGDKFQRYIEPGEAGVILASMLHSRQVDFSSDVTFTDASTDFPLLSSANGVAIVLSPLNALTDDFGAATGGTSLLRSAVETWRIAVSKTGSIAGTYFPDVVQAGPAAATAISAFTPAAQALGGLHPAAKVIWGTQGLTSAGSFGIIHGVTLSQSVGLLPAPPGPDGKIQQVSTEEEPFTIQLEIMPLTSSTKPANGAVLSITGAPDHAIGYIIDNVDQAFDIRGRLMWTMNAYKHTGL